MKCSRLVAMVMIGSIATACGKKDNGSGKVGSAVVAFENGTSAGLSLVDFPKGSTGTVVEHGSTYLTWPASTLGTKMVQIYLVEDVGGDGWDNVGQNAAIWVNPSCPVTTDDNGVTHMSDGCDTTKITDFFEFARPSADVNAALNAQKRPVGVGTYRYVRLQVCDNTVTDPNIRFASTVGGAPEPKITRTGNCVMEPAKIDPPVTIAEGDSVEVALKYDLSTAIIDWYFDVTTGTYKDGPAIDSCATSTTSKSTLCVRDFAYVPSAKKI